MTGKITLPGIIVWQTDKYAATVDGSFFKGYDVRLYWQNSHTQIWYDQSGQNRMRVRFTSKGEAFRYADNELKALVNELDVQTKAVSAILTDDTMSKEDKFKWIDRMRKL